MEASPASRRPGYWLLIAVVFPAVNWWAGLWMLVLAREVAPLLGGMPLLLALESVAVTWGRRGDHSAPGRLGTAGLLLITTLVWSFVLTLGAFALQKHAFTF